MECHWGRDGRGAEPAEVCVCVMCVAQTRHTRPPTSLCTQTVGACGKGRTTAAAAVSPPERSFASTSSHSSRQPLNVLRLRWIYGLILMWRQLGPRAMCFRLSRIHVLCASYTHISRSRVERLGDGRLDVLGATNTAPLWCEVVADPGSHCDTENTAIKNSRPCTRRGPELRSPAYSAYF